jgi:adenylate cyclase
MQFRIGVNLGDVICDESRVYGNGINIAARLDSIAEPGGICVSGAVQVQVQDKLDIAFEDLGEKQFKNIVRPVRVYRLVLDPPYSDSTSRLNERLETTAAARAHLGSGDRCHRGNDRRGGQSGVRNPGRRDLAFNTFVKAAT